MSRVELVPEIAGDFERILEHLEQHDAVNAAGRVDSIIDALDVLTRNPLIGRPASGDLRELVIGHREHGYIALYRYVTKLDTVFVLAVRSQREAGFHRD